MGEYRQLRMTIRDMAKLPPVEAPEGCEIRPFQPGDEQAWTDVMNQGLVDGWSVEKSREFLFDKPQFDPKGCFFATLKGKVVGSACAWRSAPGERDLGMVHMVCVLPDARGKNLGYLLTLAVVRYFRDSGFKEVYLTTDDHRIPAIKAYLRLGFEPDYPEPEHIERWKKVMEQITQG